MTAMQLRPHQVEAIDAIWSYWLEGGKNPVVEAPCGSGKSAMIGELSRRVVANDSRVLIATHRRELIEQDAAACRLVWPDAPVGIYSAGLNKRQIRPITVAGIQSIRKRGKQVGNVGVLIIDEAHLLSPAAQSSYRLLISDLMEINPELRVAGFTATPYRLGQGYITQGKDKLFDSIVYRVQIKSLIEQGYLSPLVTGSAGAAINTTNVGVNAGEFIVKDLELAADVDSINDAVATDVAACLATGRTSALVFGVSVAHATRMMWALRGQGVSCELITGETPAPERKRIITAFKTKKIQALSSCDVLCVGFDATNVDVIALVKPTKSASLYVQMAGRGMRISPGKTDCCVLDYSGLIATHGPVDDVTPPKPKGVGDGKSPLKMCPQCYAEVPIGARVCQDCGHEFPEIVRKANAKASVLPVLSTGERKSDKKRHKVAEVRWAKHVKAHDPEATPTLRIEYLTAYGTRIASEWICLEHDEGSFPQRKASSWWRANVGPNVPETIDEAIEDLDIGMMAKVVEIETEPDGEYTRVTKVLQERPREPGCDDVDPDGGLAVVDDSEVPF